MLWRGGPQRQAEPAKAGGSSLFKSGRRGHHQHSWTDRARRGRGWICLGTLEATRVLCQERLTLGPHSGKERVKITSASVTTPFLKRRSSSSSDEHLSLVKEKLQLVGTCLTPGHLCSQSGVQGLTLLQSRSSGAGTQVKEGRMEIPQGPRWLPSLRKRSSERPW